VDLNEAERVEVLAEDLADTRLDAEDGLVGRGAEVHDTVVEAGGERDTDELGALGLGLAVRSTRDAQPTFSKSASGREASSMEKGRGWASTAVKSYRVSGHTVAGYTLWMPIS